ncbi:MAG TPA: hypothetical protein VK625_13955 [Flavitalea sp.]|nr:hypothetical protein [Flavitalea sp.]
MSIHSDYNEVSEYLQKKSATLLALVEVSQLEADVLWLRYQV